jgi:hypothetical protein
MGGRRFGAARQIALVLGAWLAGCAIIVEPQQAAVQCEVLPGEVDPCLDLGLRCSVEGDGTQGFCQECVAEVERCNGLDDDCDDVVDEGPDDGWKPEDCNGLDDDCDEAVDEGHDEDNDGYTWCGGGKPELRDCVPTDPNIHPSGAGDPDDADTEVQELCDGKDNDCDTAIDEAGGCSQDCATNGCTGDLVCDSALNRCVAPQTVGSSCSSDAQCATGFCAAAAALALDPGVIQSGVCGTACCSSTDCASGSVCLMPGTGARVCVRPEIAGRGTGADGAECATDANCASGVCTQSVCKALCRNDASCGDAVCMLDQNLLRAGSSWFCNEGVGRGDGGDFCSVFDPTACKSGVCTDSKCVSACGNGTDCAEGLQCGYLAATGLAGASSWVTGCMPTASTVVCCTDADCGVGGRCGAAETGDHWEMHCR